MMRKMMLGFVCAAVAVFVGSTQSFGQRSAASKADGDAYYFYAGEMYGDHAVDNAEMVTDAVAAPESQAPELVQKHTGEIRRNIESAKQAYSNLSDKTKQTGEKHLDEIEKHQAKALELVGLIETEAGKDNADQALIIVYGEGIAKELKAARDVHNKLTETQQK